MLPGMISTNAIIADNFFDSAGSDNSASYLYSPGFLGSEIVMARYCPVFIASTGEKVAGLRGGHVIGESHTAVCFSEIDLRKAEKWWRKKLKPVATWVFEARLGIKVEEVPESTQTVLNYFYKFDQANLGQGADIACLEDSYKKHIERYPHKKVVLYGDSRGAATTFIFFALHKPTQVGAIVLEGIFDTMPHVITHLFKYSNKLPGVSAAWHRLLGLCLKSYKPQGPFPLHYVDDIDLETPILLVTSLKDEVVPYQCVMRLYCKLKARGHNKVHMLVLKDAWHTHYMLDGHGEKKAYEGVVHAFYRHYELPYNTALANTGQELFATTQHSVQDVQKRYMLNKPCCE